MVVYVCPRCQYLGGADRLWQFNCTASVRSVWATCDPVSRQQIKSKPGTLLEACVCASGPAEHIRTVYTIYYSHLIAVWAIKVPAILTLTVNLLFYLMAPEVKN